MKKKDKQPTPLERLHQKRHELKNIHRLERTQLLSEWDYLREHSGNLLLSGISYLFYPRRHKSSATSTTKENLWRNIRDNLPFYLAIVRESLSVLWYISRPFRFLRYRSRRKEQP